MADLKEKRDKVANEIFEEVIEKKASSNITASMLCKELEMDEEELSNYFLGLSKDNLPLGVKILNYLESNEEKNKEEIEQDN